MKNRGLISGLDLICDDTVEDKTANTAKQAKTNPLKCNKGDSNGRTTANGTDNLSAI